MGEPAAPRASDREPTAAARAFRWSDSAEPHAARRREMLERYPEIERLYGPCRRTRYVCTALVLIQFGTAYALRDAAWWLVLLVAYLLGGVINQSLLLAIHELSHNLGFRKPRYNRLFAVFINLPVGIPVAETFRYYHLLHHTYQGDERLDTDLPTPLEARLVTGPLRKMLWLALQGFAYGLRPLVVHPKRPSLAELGNFAAVLLVDALVYHYWGTKALAYGPIGTLAVMGLHPLAGHYISEHYVFREGQETYSYYGPLNRIAFNVGYHVEHHDFPYIAGSRLPALRRLAPEFYADLMHHDSWTMTLVHYVAQATLGGHRRIKRHSVRVRAR